MRPGDLLAYGTRHATTHTAGFRPVREARDAPEDRSVSAGPLLDCWQYHIREGCDVVIVTYGCPVLSVDPRLSATSTSRLACSPPARCRTFPCQTAISARSPCGSPAWTAGKQTAAGLLSAAIGDAETLRLPHQVQRVIRLTGQFGALAGYDVHAYARATLARLDQQLVGSAITTEGARQ